MLFPRLPLFVGCLYPIRRRLHERSRDLWRGFGAQGQVEAGIYSGDPQGAADHVIGTHDFR